MAFPASVLDPYSIEFGSKRPLNSDLDPSYFLRYLKIKYNSFIIIPFYHKNKSIKRYT